MNERVMNRYNIVDKENQVLEQKNMKVERRVFSELRDLTNQSIIEKKQVSMIPVSRLEPIKEEIKVEEYYYELYEHFLKNEIKYLPCDDFMKKQRDVTYQMRGTLIDWIIEVHLKFELCTETLYLCINIMDRFLSLKEISRSKYQLLGITSLWISSKYEEVYLPELSEFIDICANAYSKEEFIKMERLLLETLEFNLTVCTNITFLNEYFHYFKDLNIQYSCYYLSELSFLEPKLLSLKPSLLSSCFLFLSLKFFKNLEFWSEDLKKLTGYSFYQLNDTVNIILNLLKNNSNWKSIFKKYSHQKRNSVSLFIQKYL